MVNSKHQYHDTRNKNKLRIPQCRYTTSQKNHSYMAVKLYNSLPLEFKTLSMSCFKSKLKEILIAESLYLVNDFFDVEWSKYL